MSSGKIGNICVTDSAPGTVWRVERGSQTATAWVHDRRLQPKTSSDNPCNVTTFAGGANGLAFGARNELYVASANCGIIVRIEIDRRTAAPKVHEYIQDCQCLTGLDHIAFDVRDNLYAARNVADQLVRITPTKQIEVLAMIDDGLHFPANVAFGTGNPARGTGAQNRDELYFTNLGPAGPAAENKALKVPGRRGVSAVCREHLVGS
jgi:hypothetical protein